MLFCQFCTISSACTLFEPACKLVGIQGTWAVTYSGMWHHVAGKVVPNILKDYSTFIFRIKQCKKTSLKVKALWSLELLVQWYRRLVSSATQLWKPQISFGVHTTWVLQYCYIEKIKQAGRSTCTWSWTRGVKVMQGHFKMFLLILCTLGMWHHMVR